VRRALTASVLGVVLVATGVVLVATGPRASAAAAEPEVDAPSEDRIGARIDDGAGAGPAAPAGAPRRARRRRARSGPSSGAPVRFVVAPELRTVDGALCLAVVRRRGDPSAPAATVDEARLLQLRGRYPRCPDAAGPSRPAALPSSAEPVLRAWAEELPLPAPSLRIQPGRAIVGKAAFLEIDGPLHRQWRVEAFGWALDVEATATYTIDWGDGTVDEGITSRGGPWPSGDVRHAYLDPGTHVVSVTEQWTATWTGTGHGETRGGVLAGVLRTRATLDLPVEELQAVRVR
jgi:hypothetical protein